MLGNALVMVRSYMEKKSGCTSLRPMMSTSHVTISEIATLTSSIASPTLDLKLLRSGMPTFQHATMRSSLPGVEAPAWGVKGGGMAPASKGAGHCERGGLVASEGAGSEP